MELTLRDTRECIEAIANEADLCAISIDSYLKTIHDQNNEIQLLRNEIATKDKNTKKVFAENAHCIISSLSVLLNIIWPLTSNSDFQMSLFKNTKFIDLLFDNFLATSEMLSSSNFSLLYPIIGILSNLNSNPIIRSEIGTRSVYMLMVKPLQPSFKYLQVSVFLIYNVCCGKSLVPELLKSNLLDYLNENLVKLTNYSEIYKKLVMILNITFGLMTDDEDIKNMHSNQLKNICMNENMHKYDDDKNIILIKRKMIEFLANL